MHHTPSEHMLASMITLDSTSKSRRGRRRALLLLNVIGGSAVLASYVLWLGHPSNHAGALWGGVTGGWQHLYTISMCAAAAGYLVLFPYLARYVIDHEWLHTLFALVLFPSALWMPLTFEYVDGPTTGLWIALRCDLLTVAAASVALVVLIARTPTSAPARTRALALAGSIAFAFQTAVLDAFFWPALFPG